MILEILETLIPVIVMGCLGMHSKVGPAIVSYVNPGRTIRPKTGRCHFKAFQISVLGESLVSLFIMKYFLEVDNEVILLSNGWIWY
jgi:hypothetical protein